MITSPQGKAAIKREEGTREFAYPDPVSPLAKAYPRERWGFAPARDILHHLPASAAGLSGTPWTAGIGQTNGVTIDTRMGAEDAGRDLDRSLMRYEALVEQACTVDPTQGQFDALVCLAWNCEVAVSPKSSIIRAHNRRDWPAAAAAFSLYSNAGGKPKHLLGRTPPPRSRNLPGRIAHRVANGRPVAADSDAEKPMTSSKINLAQAGTGAIATVGAVSEALNAVGQLKEGVAGLGTWLVPLACIAVVALCAFTIYQRWGLTPQGNCMIGALAPYVLAAALAFGAGWTTNGWRLGADLAREKQTRAEAITKGVQDASSASNAMRRSAETAAREAQKRGAALSAAAADSRAESERLRLQLVEARANAANSTCASLADFATAASSVLDQCVGAYQNLAGNADKASSDVKTLTDAWPTKDSK